MERKKRCNEICKPRRKCRRDTAGLTFARVAEKLANYLAPNHVPLIDVEAAPIAARREDRC